nr:uncharacterized protein LOC123765449 isoform X1 [Procambarus clarkii]XP_045609984.1 uncharacterized protein LOC123765449 isoform X1 [Procambarus clarkii]
MGVWSRLAFRVYYSWERQRRAAYLPPFFLQAAHSSGRHQRRTRTAGSRLTLLGVTLLLLLLLPWAAWVRVQQQAAHLMGVAGAPAPSVQARAAWERVEELGLLLVGVAGTLTAAVLASCGCLAVMADHQLQGVAGVAAHEGSSSSKYLSFVRRVMMRTKRHILGFETLYMKMKNLSILLNQLVFFGMCERLLLRDERLSSLYTLMFFNVLAYSVSYVKELIQREDWSMYVNIARTSNVRHLALSSTKIVLEWTKAITFIITIVFMLLVFGLEKGLKNYHPTTGYLLITGVYFISTEKVFMDMFTSWLDYRKFEYFESMESFYCPAILISFHIILSSVITFLCVFTGNVRLIILSSFTNIRIKYRELSEGYLKPLKKELTLLAGYRVASRSEVRDHDDVCAICLARMSCARITQCQHFFHADCLRRCLKESHKCPICQYNI